MQTKDLTDKKFFSLIKSYADKKRILPPKIKKLSSDISDHLNADIICCDYVHTISKSCGKTTHTNTLNIYFKYNRDTVGNFSDVQKNKIAEIFSQCFERANYNWNSVKIPKNFYQYSLLEHGCLTPKISGEKLNVHGCSFEAEYFNRLAESCRRAITDKAKQDFDIDVFYVLSYNNSIIIFLRDEKFETLTEDMKDGLCGICRDIISSEAKKEYGNTDEKNVVFERSSKMINYR